MPPFQSGDFANKYLTILMLFYKQLNLFRPRMNAYAKALHNQVYLFILLYRRRRLCQNAEWSLRDASQASWQSRVFGYLGDCFSRCCSFAMTLRHSLPSKGGHEKSNSPEGDNLLCPPPAEVSRSDGGGCLIAGR